MRVLHIILVVMASAGLCLAAPVDNDVGKVDDYDYGRPEGDPSFLYQQMIWPDWHSLPKELFGPQYVWDTKGFPRRVEESQAQKEETNSVSISPKK
jgi:hypothetical protein